MIISSRLASMAPPGSHPTPLHEPVDRVTLASPDLPAESARLPLGLKLAAGVGLALALTGCGGGGQPPSPPAQTSPTTLSTQIAQLVKEGKQAEARQALSNGYYHQALQRFPDNEWARKALAEHRLEGDPSQANQAMEAALQQIAEGEPGRAQETARIALAVGASLEATPIGPAGILDQLRAEGGKAALEQVLTLPQRVDQRGELVREYLATLTGLSQIALDSGEQLAEPGLQAAVYQATLVEIKTSVQRDGEFLGAEAQKLVELIGTLGQMYRGGR